MVEDIRDHKEYVHVRGQICKRFVLVRQQIITVSHASLSFQLINNSHSNDPHWERKERLLRFDREFARRTRIFDDQADYQGPSTWMNDDERTFAEEKQAKRQDALKRPKQVLNLAKWKRYSAKLQIEFGIRPS